MNEGPAWLSPPCGTHSPQFAPSPPVLCSWHLWPSLDCCCNLRGQAALSCPGCSLAKASTKGAQVSGVLGLKAQCFQLS